MYFYPNAKKELRIKLILLMLTSSLTLQDKAEFMQTLAKCSVSSTSKTYPSIDFIYLFTCLTGKKEIESLISFKNSNLLFRIHGLLNLILLVILSLSFSSFAKSITNIIGKNCTII